MTHRGAGLLVALAVFAADQLAKWLIMGPLALPWRGQIELLPIFNLTWVENRGVSLGLLHADSDTGRWLLVALTGAIAAGVAWWLWREERRVDALALGLILGGAASNILDRVRLGFVADFLDLHFGEWRPFFVFNVADAAISIGVIIIVLRALFTRDMKRQPTEDGHG